MPKIYIEKRIQRDQTHRAIVDAVLVVGVKVLNAVGDLESTSQRARTGRHAQIEVNQPFDWLVDSLGKHRRNKVLPYECQKLTQQNDHREESVEYGHFVNAKCHHDGRVEGTVDGDEDQQ